MGASNSCRSVLGGLLAISFKVRALEFVPIEMINNCSPNGGDLYSGKVNIHHFHQPQGVNNCFSASCTGAKSLDNIASICNEISKFLAVFKNM